MDGRKKAWTEERRVSQRERALKQSGFLGNQKGKKRSTESKLRMSEAHKKQFSDETRHPMWRGSSPSYRAVHIWVEKWRGKPDTCEGCGKNGFKGRQIGWANKDHTYKRVLEDYIRFCAKCHSSYDHAKSLRGKSRKTSSAQASIETTTTTKSK